MPHSIDSTPSIDTGFLRGEDNTATQHQARLSGGMSATALSLTVLAFSAPIAVVEGFLPFTIAFDGPGAAFAFLLTTVLLILFAIGYVTMARYIPRTGNFYAFISEGMGKAAGLGGAFLAILSYLAILGGTYVFLGISVSALIESTHGPATNWAIWAVIGWLLVSTLGHFHIELSAKLLSIAMVIEVIIVMIFNVAVLWQGGHEGLSLTPFTPSAFLSGDVAVTLLFTVLVFLGFEATALFRDEVRTPETTIPKATYGAVIFVGLLYTLSTYALVSAYGSDAWSVAKEEPASMFANAIGVFVAPVFKQITYGSVLLSLIAASISIHNVLSRYVRNLALDRALPLMFSKVHLRHRSPHVASATIATIVAIGVAPLMLFETRGESLYGVAIGLGGLGILFLMGLVSVAIVSWFLRYNLTISESRLKTLIAPGLAAIALLATATFATLHLDLVVGGLPGQYNWLVLLFAAVFLFGVALTVFFRFKRPEIYEQLGRAG